MKNLVLLDLLEKSEKAAQLAQALPRSPHLSWSKRTIPYDQIHNRENLQDQC